MGLHDGPLCRRAARFLCELNKGGRSLPTLRNVNRLLLAIAERVNIQQRTPITERQIVRAANDWVETSWTKFDNQNEGPSKKKVRLPRQALVQILGQVA